LALFTPRPPPQHLPPIVDKKAPKFTGLADFVDFFSIEKPPKREEWESPLERKARRAKEKMDAHKAKQAEMRKEYDPHQDSNASGDPFKTLFVARISYDTTEKKLKREFEVFGSIKKVRMVYDQKGKPRGYAFVEFEHERDLKNAYKQGDGKKIDGRRVMVDVERGRTVEGWFPRRLGGGRGPGRVGKPKKKKKIAAALAAKEAERKEKDKEKDEKKDKEKDRERSKDRDREKDKDRKDRDRDRDRDEKKKDRDRDEKKEKEKDREKEKEKDKDEKKEKDRDRDEKKDKEKDRDKDEKKEKDRDRDDKKEKDRDRDKEKEKDRKRERSRSRDRSRDRKRRRD